MNIVKSIALGVAATGAAAGVAETHIASIEVIKHVGTVCGAVYAVGKLVHVAANWGNHKVKLAVSEVVEERMSVLACVKTRGMLCDKDMPLDD